MNHSRQHPQHQESSRGRQGIYRDIRQICKTFQVTHADALEALTAVGTNPEKVAEYLKHKRER